MIHGDIVQRCSQQTAVTLQQVLLFAIVTELQSGRLHLYQYSGTG